MCALASLTLAGCSFALALFAASGHGPARHMERSCDRAGPGSPAGGNVSKIPTPNKLVNEALAYGNQNLAAAMARVEQARAYLGYASAANSSPLWRGSGAAAAKAASAPTLRPLTAWPRALGALQDALHAISRGHSRAVPWPRSGPRRGILVGRAPGRVATGFVGQIPQLHRRRAGTTAGHGSGAEGSAAQPGGSNDHRLLFDSRNYDAQFEYRQADLADPRGKL